MPERVACPNGHPVTISDVECPHCRTLLDGDPIPAPSAPQLPQVPGYEVLSELGRGGMGVVYKARQLGLGRLVALKMILRGAHAGADEVARFRAEAEAAARLRHPNIVPIYEIGECAGRPYFSLEYVAGATLAAVTAGAPQPPAAAALLIETLARAIHHAHTQGVIHRDLKPANILLASGGRQPPDGSQESGDSRPPLADAVPKVTDFGLAKRVGAESLTDEGAVLGTPAYMAPEQAAGRGTAAGPAADVYALGTILYELLTGRPPFLGESALDTLHQVLTAEPVPPGRLRPALPRDLETICLKCLEKEPARRYGSALDLADDLARFREGRPVVARPVGPLGRLVRWRRRNPTLAALVAALFLALTLGLTGVTLKWLEAEHEAEEKEKALGVARTAQDLEKAARLLAEKNEAREKAERQRAETAEKKERERAESEARARRDREEFSYLVGVTLSHREWLACNVLDAKKLLDRCRPEQGGHDLRAWEWHYLRRRCDDRGALVMDAGPRGVTCLARGSRGHLISGDADGRITLWTGDGSGGPRAIPFPRTHFGEVKSLSFSPDGARLLSVGADGAVWLWDLADVRELTPLPVPKTNAAVFDPSGDRVAVAGVDGRVRVLDLPSGREVLTLDLHGPGAGGYVSAVTFSPDGGLIVAGGFNGVVAAWDATLGRLLYRRVRHHFTTRQVAFHPGGKLVASAGWDRDIRLWDAATGREVRRFFGHADEVRHIAFSADGSEVASAGDDGGVRVWETATGRELRVYRGHSCPVTAVAFLPGTPHLAAADIRGTIRLWDATREQGVTVLRGHRGHVFDVALSADGKAASAGSDFSDRTVRVWDARSGKHLATCRGHESIPLCVAFSPDGRRLAGASRTFSEGPRAPGKVILWDAATGRAEQVLAEDRGGAHSLAFAPGGRLLAWSEGSGEVRVWDVESRKEVACLRGHSEAPHRLAFRSDGELVTVARRRGALEVKMWDVARGKVVRTWTRDGLLSHDMALDRECTRLALAPVGPGAPVTLLDLASGKEVGTAGGAEGFIQVAEFSPDGRRLVTADLHGTTRVWDVASGREVLSLPHTGRGNRVAFSPDGGLLAVACGHLAGAGEVRIWDGSP